MTVPRTELGSSRGTTRRATAIEPHVRARVLVVEDDADVADALCEELREVGHDVVTAHNGQEALEVMREAHPDVVVLDLLMPVMDGWQFRVEQRRDPQLARTPVVAMSASATSAAAAVDADLYLAKPFSPDALIHAIDDVVETRERRDAPARAAHRERLAALGTLAAGIAHEINNPLTYVLLELSSLERQLDGAPRERVRQAIEGAERIRGITRSIRLLARDEVGTPGPLDPRDTARATVPLVLHELTARARLIEDYRDVPLVIADEAELGHVLVNLLTNAIQAIPVGAPASHHVRITTTTDDGGRAVIEIADTGAGIPEHLLGRIFEPFFTTRPVGQGTGLGLSISQGIVAKLGGELTVDSTPGHGATFRVVLPPASARR